MARTVIPEARKVASNPGTRPAAKQEYDRKRWYRPPLGPRAELQAHRVRDGESTARLSRPKRADPGREGRTAMPGPPQPRSLPGRPSLRHLKLEAKRRLAAGEFPTLHGAQVAIAREYGLPTWAALKQRVTIISDDSPALDQLRWIIDRFQDADQQTWTPPGTEELQQHFDERFLAVVPPPALVTTIGNMAADLRGELVVL